VALMDGPFTLLLFSVFFCGALCWVLGMIGL
jgi:hypothetical protein